MGCEKGLLGMVAQFGMYFLVHREPLSWASGWICISEPYRRGMDDLAVSNAVPLRERLQSDFSRYSGHIEAPFLQVVDCSAARDGRRREQGRKKGQFDKGCFP